MKGMYSQMHSEYNSKKTKDSKGKNIVSRAYEYHQNLLIEVKQEQRLKDIEKIHDHSLVDSFRWAFRGLYYAFRTQKNFRIEVGCGILVILLATLLSITIWQWGLILLSIFGVLGAELINTALEYMVDLYEKKFNQLAMMAKDISASFVLLSSIHAIIQGTLILGTAMFRALT